ncbi:hypothetical protein LTR91_021937 [Friedmanniomyces endolithicus]|uniref:Impact N-terminal domain-containing protein n=1 Tax=Friedmanniomyces endolithicus TaxID=329885 RepID=A0A4U0U858_9PEZI|nr:hypothetical protein LTS09_014896 [Friedmanniomyces endolithicus]KAK0267579.1 hypothetical protein LTR35_016204 [Friedmanniomyces endolithicus]KAK0297824.1 hypothetical protein LTS00_003362 [Friedmanniomyces endolithicus]KAK0306194.1 hypothetical protein LTR82_016492 [Friedmanniomyces endolithicus]KAK0909125.1 hypothetical protein LTR57_016484 [Friedmanniomyces endolithicus]
MSQKRKRTPFPPSTHPHEEIYTSPSITDRSSKFTAYFSPTLPPRTLHSNPLFATASHKILAWRHESSQRALPGHPPRYETGHDDDGEKHGGKTVAAVLTQLRVTGSCVVARWYGGVMLGPVRFAHMEECARAAVGKWREAEEEVAAERRRVEVDGVERGRLARTLVERDGSIVVLRRMALEKEGRVREAVLAGVAGLEGGDGEDGGAGEAEGRSSAAVGVAVSPSRAAPGYPSMTIDRLRALDKARDATLAFLLKRISKAEADLAALDQTKGTTPTSPGPAGD